VDTVWIKRLKEAQFGLLKPKAKSSSEALGRGDGQDDVMRVLGHSRIETALRYDHSAMARMKKAMEALESKVEK
jgi:hypothetical protein